jgi:hypothetical protein
MTRRRRMIRRMTAFGVGLAAAIALLIPGASEAQAGSYPPALRDAPRVPLPAVRRLEEARRQNLAELWNARGTMQVELGSRGTLSVQAVADPGLHFRVEERSGRVVVRAGKDMLTEGEMSLELVLVQESSGWRVVDAFVRVDGDDFRLREGTVAVEQFDATRGILDATFSLDVQSEGRRPIDLRVRDGRLSIRKSR